MFKFWGSQDQQPPAPGQSASHFWYPPSVISTPTSSRPASPSSTISNEYSIPRPLDRQPSSNVSPGEAADVISSLKGKSVEELRKLLSDKDAYNRFFSSLDQVKVQNDIHEELGKQTLNLAKENLEKEPRIMELRNQCRIIRTTELAAAGETLSDLERQRDEILKAYSPASLFHQLQDSMNKAEEESETLHQQLLNNEIDISSFVQKYKKLRILFHRKALVNLAAKTSSIS